MRTGQCAQVRLGCRAESLCSAAVATHTLSLTLSRVFSADKLTVLSRTYPTAVAGSIVNYSFHSETARFTLTYSVSPSASASSDPAATTTVIFVNRELFYKQGLRVAVQVQSEGEGGGEGVQVQVQCPSKADSSIKLQHQATASSSTASVQVTITKCMSLLGETCTCL
jgi:hypothetical protein